MAVIGLIGTGFMGRTHANAYVKSNYVDSLHVLAQSPALADAFRRQVSDVASVVTRPEDFYALPLDAVDICTPTPTHEPLIREALRHGKHILCEKPLSLAYSDCRQLAQEAATAGRLFMVAHVIRFWPEYAYLKNLVHDQTFGPLRSLRFERYSPLPAWGDWFADLQGSGGALFDLHIHDVDFARYLLGEPAAVSSVGRKADGVAYLDIETTMRYGNDSFVSIYGSYDLPRSTPFRMQFRALFERACLDYDIWRDPTLRLYHPDKLEDLDLSSSPNGYELECDYFAHCVAEGKAPDESSAKDSSETIRLLEAIARSADQGGLWMSP